MHAYPYFSTKLTKKKSFYSKHAEEIFKGGVLAMKQKTIWMEWRHAENLDENVDEDYTCKYKHGTAAAERRGTVSCEIIQRQLLN